VNPASAQAAAAPLLVCAPNWLGDGIMCMPAVQEYRAAHDTPLAVLVKPGLAPLWRMQAAADEILVYTPEARETVRAAARLRRRVFRGAVVLPNSFRSAFLPWAGRVSPRRGRCGHWRGPLLTDVAAPGAAAAAGHQAGEYYELLGMPPADPVPPPRLTPGPEAEEECRRRFGIEPGRRYAALSPGAARGPSKRWPEEHFAAVGRALAGRGAAIVILGGRDEAALCERVAEAVGGSARSLAGRASLPAAAAVLAHCAVAVTNDSGGMHLAAAAGTRVVAVFGLTDPAKTGPLGPGHTVIAAPGARGARDIPRASAEAAACLRGIDPERVASAAIEALA